MLRVVTLSKPAVEQDVRCKGLRPWAAGAGVAFASSFAFPLVGALLAPTLTTIETASIVPLLIVGFICLTQALKRSTPEPYGCSPRRLPDTTTQHDV
jgi:hypothetical protein